ncbi:ubiquitin carboxyl-terminal hydrolase 14 [Condylostylus longicornis]|uniref:ubiquitin carboxyl-terminal hydrolase 14 n=1 Tax=Condylostylus longicornis TaxID=2530218 RepID=UPI00244E58A9|nr:ubiquitin carboxyl-terminal hydrolase 14 [Condylostylus longicornis]
MPSFTVKVKWGKEIFNSIEVNNDEEPLVFKAQLYALTGVQPERQKVMCKGCVLKDDEWNMQLKDGLTILLLGTKEEVPKEPVEKTLFVEDMNESELATALELPAGLSNLGNTCYMNAVVQCLKSVPELSDTLQNFDDNISLNLSAPSTSITAALKLLFREMDKEKTVTPILFVQTMHLAFPQFAQTGENGTYRQQDASECWSELLKMLQQKLPPKDSTEAKKYNSFIEQFFGGKFQVTMKCDEAPEEPVKVSEETFLQLNCFISSEVKYMHNGVKSKLKETLTKNSESLGRDALYTKSSLINRLPAYLTVQFVRFEYKGKEGINAKILKDIKFSLDFDVFEMCTPALQKKLTPMREKFKEVEDRKLFNKGNSSVNNEKKVESYENYWFDDDFGSNNSGYYTLQAVLTHKGRSSSSGHYVAWVKQKSGSWVKFDDDMVSSVTEEEILRLSGGGDWHCAYVLLYGPKLLEKTEEKAV